MRDESKCHDCDKPHDNCRYTGLDWLYCLDCAVRLNSEFSNTACLDGLPYGPVDIPDELRQKHQTA